MPYITVGADGRWRPDSYTEFAKGELLPTAMAAREVALGIMDDIEPDDGLGKRKKKGFLKKRFEKHLKIIKKVSKLTPGGMLVSKLMQMKKAKKRRGAAPGEEYEEAVTVPEESPPSYPVPEESAPSEPIPEESAPPPPSIEQRAAAEPEPVPEESAPARPMRPEGGYTIPGDEERTEEYAEAPAEPPESSVEGACCGGYIVEATSPKEAIFEHPKLTARALRARGRGPQIPGMKLAVPFMARHRRPTWAEALSPRRDRMLRRGRGRRPFGVSGLGQEAVSESARSQAMKDYALIARQAQAESEWLAGVNAANWTDRVPESGRMIGALYNSHTKLVQGKTGNPEAEERLLKLLNDLNAQHRKLVREAPGVITQALAKIGRFFVDFARGAQEAWQGYSAWALSASGPALKKWHEANVRLIDLKNDLKQARGSGKFTEGQLRAQAQKIAGAEAALDGIRETFRFVSAGVSIDDVAQSEYGKYPMLGAIQIATAIAIAIIAAAVILAVGLVFAINKLAAQAPGSLILVAGLVVLGVVVLPKLFGPKRAGATA